MSERKELGHGTDVSVGCAVARAVDLSFSEDMCVDLVSRGRGPFVERPDY